MQPPTGMNDNGPDLALILIARIRDVFTRIAANPRLHGTVYHDVRKAVVGRFPYVVLYREDAGEVVVIAVFHTSREPSIWQSRA